MSESNMLSKGTGMLTYHLYNATFPVGEKCFSQFRDDGIVYKIKAINKGHLFYGKIIRENYVNAFSTFNHLNYIQRANV